MRNDRDRRCSGAPHCQLETLESRALLSAGMSIEHGILTIQGTGHDDILRITRLNRNLAQWVVRVNGEKTMLHPDQIAQIREIVVRAGAGDDQVFLDGMDTFTANGPSGWGQQGVDKPALVMGGLGDDTITGSYGDDVLDGGPGDDKIAGADGIDTVRGGSGDDFLAGDDFTGVSFPHNFTFPGPPPRSWDMPYVNPQEWLLNGFFMGFQPDVTRRFQPRVIRDQAIDGGPGQDHAPIFNPLEERIWNVESYQGQEVRLVGTLAPRAPGVDLRGGDSTIITKTQSVEADTSKVGQQAVILMNKKVLVEGTIAYVTGYTRWLHIILKIEKMSPA